MRLDKFLSERGMFSSRTKAARALQEGLVLINGKPAKASDDVGDRDEITLIQQGRTFVSEGGYKLQKAFDEFGSSVAGKVIADIGASTGGFTDCLLQAGAKRVYAVDVGKSQLAPVLANDPRVVIMDGCNARYLTAAAFPEPLDGVTIDVSFISLTLVLPAVSSLLSANGTLHALIKPQFEVGVQGLGKNGIVRDAVARESAVCSVAAYAETAGLYLQRLTTAPLHAHKNVEYIALFGKDIASRRDAEELLQILRRA